MFEIMFIPFIVSIYWFIKAKKINKEKIALKIMLNTVPYYVMYFYLWYLANEYIRDINLFLSYALIHIIFIAQHFLFTYSFVSYQRHKYATVVFNVLESIFLYFLVFPSSQKAADGNIFGFNWVHFLPFMVLLACILNGILFFFYICMCTTDSFKDENN